MSGYFVPVRTAVPLPPGFPNTLFEIEMKKWRSLPSGSIDADLEQIQSVCYFWLVRCLKESNALYGKSKTETSSAAMVKVMEGVMSGWSVEAGISGLCFNVVLDISPEIRATDMKCRAVFRSRHKYLTCQRWRLLGPQICRILWS